MPGSFPEGWSCRFLQASQVHCLCSTRQGSDPLVCLSQLLPIPDSLPISPDDGEHADIYKLRIRVRGNLEWAPPRPQIIFNIHPAPT